MKTGIIIHSHTNNTLSVGQRLADAMLAQGDFVKLERVIAVNEDPNAKEKVQLAAVPDVAAYDYIILGAPVRGFSLSPVMTAYLAALSDLKGKRVACFVTEHFPKPWLGGSRAIKQMVQYISRRGGSVTQTAIINWTNKARETQIQHLTAAFSHSTAHNI
jgi:flavodoxin